MQINPLKQFEIISFFEKDPLSRYGLEFTNSSLMMFILVLLFFSFSFIALRKTNLIPSRLQVANETLFNIVEQSFSGLDCKIKKIFLPMIFTIFIFILLANLLGNIPYSFTITSHIIVTSIIAAFFFLVLTAIALINKGKQFFKMFFPSDVPWWMMPLISMIEFFSYLSKPIVLCLRLTINVVAGHIMIKIVASLMSFILIYFGIFMIPLLSILLCFEILVSVLQAYIFMILSCTYIKDMFSMH
ncbi:MAG: F0F1 ATP synthase subunit A [Rickettsia sp.]|nr:F0F1 ATP synthase subunit A [Rickettsia sp.]